MSLEFSFADLADANTAIARVTPSNGVIPVNLAMVVSADELPLNLVNQAKNDR
jgi:hypothetical protein